MSAKVKVKLNKDGTISVEGSGMQGPGCLTIIEKLSSKLGVSTDEHLLNEYYEGAEQIHVGTDSSE